MTPTLPPGHIVRFDYHRHPRSTTAVVINQATRNVVAVGVAKFNPKDGQPDAMTGEKIALHRALQSLARPHKMRELLPHFRVPDLTAEVDRAVRLAEERFGRSWQGFSASHGADESTLDQYRRYQRRHAESVPETW
jgi:hypothetical protein